jgi:hypothetical protein
MTAGHHSFPQRGPTLADRASLKLRTVAVVFLQVTDWSVLRFADTVLSWNMNTGKLLACSGLSNPWHCCGSCITKQCWYCATQLALAGVCSTDCGESWGTASVKSIQQIASCWAGGVAC